MKRAAAILAPLAALLSATGGEASPPIVVHYYAQWSVWIRRFCVDRLGDTQAFRDITHIQYAFMAPNAQCEIESPDLDADQGGLEWQLPCEIQCPGPLTWDKVTQRGLHRGNMGCLSKIIQERGIKLGISLGGWTLSTHFSDCVATEANRQKLINSISKDIDYFGWDFVDFDWEYPAGGGNDGPLIGKQEDWANFQTFLLALKAKRPDVGYAAAVGVNADLLRGTGRYNNPTPAKFLCEQLDYVSLMTYDMMGGWDKIVGWPAPLYHDPAAKYALAAEHNIKWSLEWWKEQCGDKFNKVVLGLPMYGKSWKGVPAGPDGNGMYQDSVGVGSTFPYLGEGSYVGSEGTMEIWDIHMNYLTNSQCKHYFHEVAKQDFIYCPGTVFDSKDLWFGYDGPEVMYEKTKLAREMGAGGVMYWEPGYTWFQPDLVNWDYVTDKKEAHTRARLAEGVATRWWDMYEAAIFDAWDGKPIDTHRSAGIRVGDPNGTPEPPSSTEPTSSTTTTTKASEPESPSTVNCDEVSNAVMNGVTKSCMTSFCSATCKHFMAGACKGSADAHECLHTKFYEIPPAGHNGIQCAF